MLGNILDRRTDPFTPECDVAFEPSAHDNAKRPDGSPWFDYDEASRDPAYFHVADLVDTTIREVILRAETDWPFAVTVFIYDRGTRPLG